MKKQKKILKFVLALRKLGFRKTHEQRVTAGSPSIVLYERVYPEDECRVEVQLWGDGKHRMSYWHPNLFVEQKDRTPYGHMTTMPADFTTVDQMLVVLQQQRVDWLTNEKAIEEKVVDLYRRTGKMVDRAEVRDVKTA